MVDGYSRVQRKYRQVVPHRVRINAIGILVVEIESVSTAKQTEMFEGNFCLPLTHARAPVVISANRDRECIGLDHFQIECRLTALGAGLQRALHMANRFLSLKAANRSLQIT